MSKATPNTRRPLFIVSCYSLPTREKRHIHFHVEVNARQFYERLTRTDSIAFAEIVRLDGTTTTTIVQHFAEPEGGDA